MASIVMFSAEVTLNGVDISTACTRAELTWTIDPQDETAFGDTYRHRKPGLTEWNMALDILTDYNTGIDANIFGLRTSTFQITLKADTAAAGLLNPKYSGQGMIGDWTVLGGGVGELATSRLTVLSSSELSRDTA